MTSGINDSHVSIMGTNKSMGVQHTAHTKFIPTNHPGISGNISENWVASQYPGKKFINTGKCCAQGAHTACRSRIVRAGTL